jgi:hypothetical protein
MPGLEPFFTDELISTLIEDKGIPQRLYHYTSINTLIFILKNATLRFNRLDRVNDFQEASSADLLSSNTTQFVSCWTDDPSEQLPLWELYTKMRGVRIGLPTNMFLGRPCITFFDRGGFQTHLNKSYHIEREVLGKNTNLLFGANPVYYTDDNDLLFPNIVFDIGDPYHENISHIEIRPLDLGNIKNLYWAFEKEWRFKLSLFDVGEIFPFDSFGKLKVDLVNNPVITQYLDVDLDRKAFAEMDILLGPKTTYKDYTRVKSLLKRYADYSSIKIEFSLIPIRTPID